MGVHTRRPPSPARLRRLGEELEEVGFAFGDDAAWRELLLTEVDVALRPVVFEGRVPSLGSILEPRSDPASWEAGTELSISHAPIQLEVDDARRFADGLSSWLIRRCEGPTEWCVFDRPSGSERDLVVLAEVLAATIVQRHPTGAVRVVGPQGVLRWSGTEWRLERPLGSWIDAVVTSTAHGEPKVLAALLEFAVHDLGSRGIGAILIYRPDDSEAPSLEQRLPTPPPLSLHRATALAPLRHALAQVDGAAVFGRTGTLEQLGVRLIPSPEAEQTVAGFRGMRHTAGRRYSHDDPTATVIIVSEDGPVTVLRAAELVGVSRTEAQPTEPSATGDD